jgi:hypothetical protein
MGSIVVADYLEMLGWDVTYENRRLVVTRVALPDLAAFDPALLSYSVNHIDLLQFVLDNGYLGAPGNFIENIQIVSSRMLACTPTMTPDQAKAAIAHAIGTDAKRQACRCAEFGNRHQPHVS